MYVVYWCFKNTGLGEEGTLMKKIVFIVCMLGIGLSLGSQAIAQFNNAFKILQSELDGAEVVSQRLV